MNKEQRRNQGRNRRTIHFKDLNGGESYVREYTLMGGAICLGGDTVLILYRPAIEALIETLQYFLDNGRLPLAGTKRSLELQQRLSRKL